MQRLVRNVTLGALVLAALLWVPVGCAGSGTVGNVPDGGEAGDDGGPRGAPMDGGEGDGDGDGDGDMDGGTPTDGGDGVDGGGGVGELGPTLYNHIGWLEITPEGEHLFIEAGDEVLPAECDGLLGVADGSAGLALVEKAPEATFHTLLEAGDLAPRPGLVGAPRLIGDVTGEVRIGDLEGHPRATRRLEAQVRNGFGWLLFLDVCDTVLTRGACHVPGPTFSFAGCAGAPSEPASFIIPDLEISFDGVERWTMEYSVGYECDNDTLSASHPPDWQIGKQTLEITAADLADGELVELTLDQVAWSGSFKSVQDCNYIEDLGDVCSCTWSAATVETLHRGWMIREGDKIHLELKADNSEEGFYLWGTFDIAP